MGIAAIANDYLTGPFNYGVGKESTTTVGETINFGQKLQAETEKKCPYSFLAKDGIIQYITNLSIMKPRSKSKSVVRK